jgi:hypothetical protein
MVRVSLFVWNLEVKSKEKDNKPDICCAVENDPHRRDKDGRVARS